MASGPASRMTAGIPSTRSVLGWRSSRTGGSGEDLEAHLDLLTAVLTLEARRGPSYRALKPQNGSVMDLPAGGSVTIEITCQWVALPSSLSTAEATDCSKLVAGCSLVHSSYGTQTSDPNDPLSACPNGYGPHHAGDPAGPIVENLVSRCALGVADKDDDEKVGWDDIVIFSVTHRCVRQRLTTFKVHLPYPLAALNVLTTSSQIPDRMPACSGSKCICGWSVRPLARLLVRSSLIFQTRRFWCATVLPLDKSVLADLAIRCAAG